VLLLAQLQSYSLTGNGDFPRISKAEIEGKSKGDAISKMFALLLIGWFAIQCVARIYQGLPITELELVTVAFATLNFMIYLLWWHKPLNGHHGVRVFKQRVTEQPIDDGDADADVGYWDALQGAFSELPAAIADGPSSPEFPQVLWLYRVTEWPFNKSLQIKWVPRRALPVLPGLVMTTIASAFGGIHCIGWSFTFPSSTLGESSGVSIPLLYLLSHLCFSYPHLD